MKLGNLTENEVREIIRRRIISDHLRYSRSQRLFLFDQEADNSIILKEEMTFDDAKTAYEIANGDFDALTDLFGGDEPEEDLWPKVKQWAWRLGGLGVGIGVGYILWPFTAVGLSLWWVAGLSLVPMIIGETRATFIRMGEKEKAAKEAAENIKDSALESYFTSSNPAIKIKNDIKDAIESKTLYLPAKSDKDSVDIDTTELDEEFNNINNIPVSDDMNAERLTSDQEAAVKKVIDKPNDNKLKPVGNEEGDEDIDKYLNKTKNDFLGVNIDSIDFEVDEDEINDYADKILKAIGESDHDTVWNTLSNIPMSHWHLVDQVVGELALGSVAYVKSDFTSSDTYFSDEYKIMFANSYDSNMDGGYNFFTSTNGFSDEFSDDPTERGKVRALFYDEFEQLVNKKGRTSSIIITMILHSNYKTGPWKDKAAVLEDFNKNLKSNNPNTYYFIRLQPGGDVTADNVITNSKMYKDDGFRHLTRKFEPDAIGIDPRFLAEVESLEPELGWFEKIKEWFNEKWEATKETFDKWGKKIGDTWGGIKQSISDTFTGVKDWLSGLFSDGISGIWDGIKNAFKTATDWIVQGPWAWVKSLIEWLKSWFTKKAKPAEIEGLPDGGGTGGDSVASTRSDGTGVRRRGGRTRRPQVREMQAKINDIIEADNMNIRKTGEDGIWGPDTNRVWVSVIENNFSDVFPDDDASRSVMDWPAMSALLNDETGRKYPEFTPDPNGALAIIDYIAQQKGITSGGGGSIGGTGGSRRSSSIGSGRGTGTTSRGSFGSPRDIEVMVDAGNNDNKTLESIGFPQGTTENMKDVVGQAIRSYNFAGGSVKLKVSFNTNSEGLKQVGRITTVKRDKTQKIADMTAFKGLRAAVRRLLKSSGNKVDPDKIARRGRLVRNDFSLIIRIPRGSKI